MVSSYVPPRSKLPNFADYQHVYEEQDHNWAEQESVAIQTVVILRAVECFGVQEMLKTACGSCYQEVSASYRVVSNQTDGFKTFELGCFFSKF